MSMWKALLKKQFLELFSWAIQNRRNGKRRSNLTLLLFGGLGVALAGFLAFAFYEMGDVLYVPLSALGLLWLYYAVMGALSLLAGVFVCLFSAYSTLYRAQDTAFLLSLPIPPARILTIRLLGIGGWALLSQLIALLPALAVAWSHEGLRPLPVLMGLLLILALALLTLTLSCAVGWIVAKISAKLKHQTLATVLLFLLGLAAYFVLIFRAPAAIGSFLLNALVAGQSIRSAFPPLYWLGLAGMGDARCTLLITAFCVLVFALAYLVLSRSFLRMGLQEARSVKKTYREAAVRQRSLRAALLGKELHRLGATSFYLLNCCSGTLFLVVCGVVLLIKVQDARRLLALLPFLTGLLPLIACAALCLCASMNYLTAPSVSLEAKQLWLLKSLPISPWTALRAKLEMHSLVTLPAVLFASGSMIFVLRPAPVTACLIVLVPLLFGVLCAAIGLCVNLKLPSLTWTNENTVIKQSASVLLSLPLSWCVIIALGALYYALRSLIDPQAYLLGCAAALLLMVLGLLGWLRTRGCKLWNAL